MKDKAAHVHAAHGLERSPKWERVRKAFLKANPYCEVCHKETWLQVHHVLPFHLCILVAKRPDLELDPRNLITLCEPPGPQSCHHSLGHLGDYRIYNPRVRACASIGIEAWRPLDKPPILEMMTASDKRAFRALVKKLYGKAP